MDHLFWLILFIAGLYVSYRLLRIGLRREVEPGHVTRCATCEYDLTANTSGVCPECGASIAHNTIRGHYTRAWGLTTFAAILILICLYGIRSNWYQPLYSYSWLTHAPTRMLLWQTYLPQKVANSAWQTLEMRLREGKLNADQQSLFADRAFAVSRQPATPGVPQYIPFQAISYAIASGGATPQRINQLKAAMPPITPALSARDQTTVGREIPLATHFETPPAEGLWYYLEYKNFLDDADTPILTGRYPSHAGASTSLNTDRLPSQPIGKHKVKAAYRFHVYLGPWHDFPASQWLFAVDTTASAQFEVLPDLPAALLKDSPSDAETIQKNALITLTYTAQTRLLEGKLLCQKLPVNVIARIVIDTGDARHPVGIFWGHQRNNDASITLSLPDCPPKVRLILEPNPDAALGTTNTNQILGNTVTFDDVPVARR